MWSWLIPDWSKLKKPSKSFYQKTGKAIDKQYAKIQITDYLF